WAIGQKHCPAALIAPAFAKWRMLGGVQPFHRAMLLLNRDALEPVNFCAMRCNQISEHEALIISMICTLGDRGPRDVRDTLALMVEEDSIGDLLGALSALATAMDGAAILPVRPSCATRSPSDGG